MCSIICESPPVPEVAGDARPLRELEREICELAGHLAAATCRWLLLLGEFDERNGWAEWGVTSCAHWLSWKCSIDLVTAREQLRVARRLRELALVREAFASGELSYSKVRALTRVATPETEQDLVELARHATGGQLDKLVRGYRGALEASTARAWEAQAQRYLRWSWDDDGSLMIKGRLSPEDGALLVSALEAAEERPPDNAGDSAEASPADSPVGARRADALVSLARGALETGPRARAGGDPCQLVVHVDTATLVAERVQERSELEHGPVLAPETVRRLGCDAAVVRIIEQDGKPLSVGRRTRTIPPALRRALRSRDGGCAFPGCTHGRFLHAHHIEHWARGGETKLTNLVQLCSHHHRLVHEGGYQVERVGSRGIRFRRPDGREIPPVPNAVRARGATLRGQHDARGLVIDENTCQPRSHGDTLDYDIAVECLLRKQLGG
jgi:hypothetical protein